MVNSEDENRIVADTIGKRVRIDKDEVVAGWQAMLAGILTKMRPYLTGGRLVTFQHLLPQEKSFFGTLLKTVQVPGHVMAFYMPPSVRYQMMSAYHENRERIFADHDPEHPPDAGVILSAADGFEVIVNALFAYPPALAAVDVYEAGCLIAGYTYRSIDECVSSLTALMQTHL